MNQNQRDEYEKRQKGLKVQLTETLNNITQLNSMLLSCDADAVRDGLKAAERAIRPMLYAMRSPEENAEQRKKDSYN